MTTTLSLFWNLSSNDADERLQSSTKLIQSLEQFQEQFQAPNEAENSDSEEVLGQKAVARDVLEKCHAPDVSYTIRRLIRGLASSRESSRLGFVVALTELISRLDTLSTNQAVTLILESSQTSGGMSGQEERDVLFARLFGLASVVESGLVFREGSTSRTPSDPFTTFEDYSRIFSEAMQLGAKKSWIKETAWWLICRILRRTQSSSAPWKDEAFQVFLDRIFDSDDRTWTPEKIAVFLEMRQLQPQRDWSSVLSPTFKGQPILSHKNLPVLSRILKDEGAEQDEGVSTATSSGAWKPKPHFVWDHILDTLFTSTVGEGPVVSLHDFFRVVVDDVMFANNASAARKYHGFQIFERCLLRASDSDLPLLFTPNLMRTWINHLTHSDRYLNKMALHLGKQLQALVQSRSTAALPIVTTLMGSNGIQQFDKLTKTKTVESILMASDSEVVMQYVEHLMKQFTPEEETDPTNPDVLHSRRLWVIDQLAITIRNGTIPTDEDIVRLVLDFLISHGLFTVKKNSGKLHAKLILPAKPPLSDELRERCRARLLACLSDLLAQPRPNTSATKQPEMPLSHCWTIHVIEIICAKEGDAKSFKPLTGISPAEAIQRKQAVECMLALKTLEGERRETAFGAHLLVAGAILHAYCGAEGGPEPDFLEELIRPVRLLCQKDDHMTLSNGLSITKESPPIDFVVDIVIGFMEKSSAYLRAIAKQSFGYLCHELQDTSIDLILALEVRKPDEDGESSANDSGDENEGSEDSGASGSTVSPTDGVPSEDENSEDNHELRTKLEAVLGTNDAKIPDGDASDSSMDEEEVLDDDQMMQFDDRLADVFRLRQHEKGINSGVKDAQRRATHFKNRILDLIEVFIKQQAANPLVTQLVVPLLDCVIGASKDEKQFADKITGIIRSKLVQGKVLPINVDGARVSASLSKLHKIARRLHSQEHLALINACSIYLSRILSKDGTAEHVSRVYDETLSEFSRRKTCSIPPIFFEEFCKRLPEIAWTIKMRFVEEVNLAINGYRKTHIFEFITRCISQIDRDSKSDEMEAFLKAYSTALCTNVAAACAQDGAKSLNAQQLKDTCKAAMTIARISRKSRYTGWDIAALKSTMALIERSDRFRQSAAATLWARLLETLSHDPVPIAEVEDTTIGKRKATDLDSSATGQGEKLPKAKRKKVRHKPMK